MVNFLKVKDFLVSKIYYPYRYYRLKNIRKHIWVYNAEDTLNYILDNGCSVSRFGDGEFNMVFRYITHNTYEVGESFQRYDARLAKRLYEILQLESTHNHIICIPYWFREHTDIYRPEARLFCERYMYLNHKLIARSIRSNQYYFNANITRFYLSYKDKSGCKPYVARLKKIWDSRDICFIEGVYSRLGVGNDLFSNAKSIKRILCPATDAYSCYDEIVNCVQDKVSKETLLLIALGHTATVLAYDLSQMGYQAIDLGHVDVEYEWMLMGATTKVSINNKYVNEVGKENNHILGYVDEKYDSQIIANIPASLKTVEKR